MQLRIARALALSLLLLATFHGTRAEAGTDICFCCSPRPGMTASGMRLNGMPSMGFIRWGSTTVSTPIMPGDTCTTIMTNLKAAFDADPNTPPSGPVVTDPMTGRAVFCAPGVNAPPAGGINSGENDTGIREITFARIFDAATDPFLRGIVGANILANAQPQGGSAGVEVGAVTQQGNPVLVAVQVQTHFGMSGAQLDQALIASLNQQGLQASMGMAEYMSGQFAPAILIDPGSFARIDSVASISDDPGVTELAAGAITDEGSGIPALGPLGVVALGCGLVGAGALVRRRFSACPA